jgi:hypothetical protein
MVSPTTKTILFYAATLLMGLFLASSGCGPDPVTVTGDGSAANPLPHATMDKGKRQTPRP